MAQEIITEVPRENVTAHPQRSLAHAAMSMLLRGTEAAGRLLPGTAGNAAATRLEHRLQRDARARQPLTWQERLALIPVLENDIRLLEKITEADFSDWLRPRPDSGGQVGNRPAGQYQARNGQPGR